MRAETPIEGDRAFPDDWRDRVDRGSGLELYPSTRQPFAGTAVELIDLSAAAVEGLWDPLAAIMASGYPVGSFAVVRVDIEETEGPEVGFTRPVEGEPNIEYLETVDRAAVEDVLMEVLNR